MTTGHTGRIVGAVLVPAAVGIGAILGGTGIATAQSAVAPPGITEWDLDDEDGRPTLEVDYVDLQGNAREVEIDLQTGRILEDEPADDD